MPTILPMEVECDWGLEGCLVASPVKPIANVLGSRILRGDAAPYIAPLFHRPGGIHNENTFTHDIMHHTTHLLIMHNTYTLTYVCVYTNGCLYNIAMHVRTCSHHHIHQ